MKKLFVALLVFISFLANGQYFQTGQDPASIKWRQINTDNFQLIYPDYYEREAQELAQKLEAVYSLGSYSLKHQPKKISIILHTQTVKSNGLVAYAPKRSEFYTTPHQRIYPQDWLEQLAIHEFRHVVQIDKLNSELPKIIKVLLGEQGTALVFGAYLPWWFIEGDAVVTETALSNYGRGRFPSFLMEHRAQVVENGKYSYDKAYLGSYKSFVPDHYKLGYYMVGNTRYRYGSELWEKTIKRVGEKPLSLTPFNKALKLEIGMGKVQLYNSVFDSLAVVWQNEDRKYVSSPIQNISKKAKVFTSYQYNFWLNDTEIISYKTAYNKRSAFVKVDLKGNEEIIYYPGFIFNESVNFRKEWLVWSEQIPDLRWSHSGRSKIIALNVNTKKKLSFWPEYKAFAPAISPDLDKVIVVETDFSSNNYLSVYRISSGELIHRIQTNDNNFFFSPAWINDAEVACVMLTNQGKRLARFNVESGELEILIKRDLGELKHLRMVDNSLYFICGLSGKNALYKYSFENQQTEQLYKPRFGVEYPSVNSSGNIIVSDYTGNGFQLIQLDEKKEIPLNNVTPKVYEVATALGKQELGIPDFTTSDTTKYSSKRYSKPANLLNFHSWAPIFVDAVDYEFMPGVSFMSQNKLGTAATVLGYKWDTSEKTGQFYANYTYKGWYPVFSLEFTKGKRASNYWQITEYGNENGEIVERDTTLKRFTWNETELTTDVSLPLNLTQGKYYRLLQPELNYGLTWYKNTSSTPESFPDGTYQSFQYRLYYHQLLRQSYQDVYPNFGFVLDAHYRHSPNGNEGLGSMSAASGVVYLPGLMPNHGLRIYGGAQDKKSGDVFRFSDAIAFPRGWDKIETNQLLSLRTNYKLPLINPDWSLGGLAYFKRISATLFADFANLEGNHYQNGELAGTYNTNISSYGVEVFGDIHFLRFYAPIKIGVRSSYLPEIEDISFDFLISVDFNSL